MSIKSGLFSSIMAILLIGALGNPFTQDLFEDLRDGYLLGADFQSVFSWDIAGLSTRDQAAQIVQLLLIVAGVFVLGGLAGRARPLSAFVGGWGMSFGAVGIAGMASGLIAASDESSLGRAVEVAYPSATQSTTMLLYGWLFGITVMLGSFGKNQPKMPMRKAPAPTAAVPPMTPPGWEQPSASTGQSPEALTAPIGSGAAAPPAAVPPTTPSATAGADLSKADPDAVDTDLTDAAAGAEAVTTHTDPQAQSSP